MDAIQDKYCNCVITLSNLSQVTYIVNCTFVFIFYNMYFFVIEGTEENGENRYMTNYNQFTVQNFSFLCRLRSIATHRGSLCPSSVRPSICLSVRPSHFQKLCFTGNTCIPRNAATIFFNYPHLSCTCTEICSIATIKNKQTSSMFRIYFY